MTAWQSRCESGGCVQTRTVGDVVEVRDSAAPERVLRVPAVSWAAFLAEERGEVRRTEWRVVGVPVTNVLRPEFEFEADSEAEAREFIACAESRPDWTWPWAKGPFLESRTTSVSPWRRVAEVRDEEEGNGDG